MRQLFRKMLCCLIVVMLLGAVIPVGSAADYSAQLQSLHYDIAIQEDGSARITEYREIALYGDFTFTYYGIQVNYTGPRRISDWQIFINGEPMMQLNEPDDENRPENTFAVVEEEGGCTLYTYYRATGGTTLLFEIGYRVENAIKLYSDVGEFFWNLTGETGISGIGQLTASVTVPEGVEQEELRIWAHGPLDGIFEKMEDGSAYLYVEYVSLGTIVDIRTTVPAQYFTGGWAQEGEGLPEILEVEQALADIANAQREEEARQEAEWEAYWAQRDAWAEEHPFLAGVQGLCESIYDFFYYNIEDQLSGFTMFGAVIVFIVTLVFGKPKRNPKKERLPPAQAPEYYRELPDDRPAPAVDRLVHFYKKDGNPSTSRQISAAMLELNLQKRVRLSSGVRGTEIVLASPMGGTQELDEGYQEALWQFLQEVAGDTGRIRMKDLQKYVKDHREDAYRFRREFEDAVEQAFTRRVKLQEGNGSFLGTNKLLLCAPVVAGILAVLVRMFCTLYDGVDVGAALVVGGITFGITAIWVLVYRLAKAFFSAPTYVLNQQSEDDLALWQAFGRFLDDFTTFDKKELPEFPVWRRYMVYAVAMGKGKKVAKALAVNYPEAFASEEGYDDDFQRMLQDMALYETLDAIGQEVVQVKAPPSSSSSSNDSDNWSDSSGGGGGFSSSGGGSDSGSGGDFIG